MKTLVLACIACWELKSPSVFFSVVGKRNHGQPCQRLVTIGKIALTRAMDEFLRFRQALVFFFFVREELSFYIGLI